MECDPVSAFGGIVSCNFKINKNLAVELNKKFFEVVIGNGIEKDAFKILSKKNNLRIIDSNNLKLQDVENVVSNFNSILIQTSDTKVFSPKNFKVVSKTKPNSKVDQ